MDKIDKLSFDENPEFLADLKKKSGFNVPEHYFSNMQESVLSQVLKDEKTSTSSPEIIKAPWWKSMEFVLQPQYAMMAAIGLILLIVSINIGPETTEIDTAQAAFANLSDDDLEYYLEAGFEEMNNQDLYAVLTSNDMETVTPITSINVPTEIADQYIEDMDESTILDFHHQDEQ